MAAQVPCGDGAAALPGADAAAALLRHPPAKARGAREHQRRLRGVPHPGAQVEEEAANVEYEGQVRALDDAARRCKGVG